MATRGDTHLYHTSNTILEPAQTLNSFLFFMLLQGLRAEAQDYLGRDGTTGNIVQGSVGIFFKFHQITGLLNDDLDAGRK